MKKQDSSLTLPLIGAAVGVLGLFAVLIFPYLFSRGAVLFLTERDPAFTLYNDTSDPVTYTTAYYLDYKPDRGYIATPPRTLKSGEKQRGVQASCVFVLNEAGEEVKSFSFKNNLWDFLLLERGEQRTAYLSHEQHPCGIYLEDIHFCRASGEGFIPREECFLKNE